MTKEEIKAKAHIVNGGEVALTQCPSCRGSGRFRTYSGRDGGACYKCKGKGGITARQVAAAKGKETKLANQAAWKEEHSAALAYIQKRAAKGSTFYGSFLDKLTSYGTLTENQLAVAYKDMAKDAAFWEAKKAERAAAAPVVPTEALEALFDRAPVKLAKTAIFRTTEITIKRAKAESRNPGGLYVYDTDSKDYLGKIVDGKWSAKWGTKDVTEALKAVAADPTGEAIKYAAKFKACCCCGKALWNPVSVLAVVGPVCGPRWGLDHLRMAAAALLDEEKAAEEAAKEATA
jgi:hypothetical protein